MFQHSNSRLTPRGRQRLVDRVRAGESVSAAARDAGAGRQTAHKWIARAEAGEPLSDRRSRPSRLARLTPPDVEARVVEARRARLLAPLALAAETGVPARTCARIVARNGLPRLADVDRVTGEPRRRGPVTARRYERGEARRARARGRKEGREGPRRLCFVNLSFHKTASVRFTRQREDSSRTSVALAPILSSPTAPRA